MKCIERKDGTVDRVKDDVAEKEVANGNAKYVSKERWKLATGRWPKDQV